MPFQRWENGGSERILYSIPELVRGGVRVHTWSFHDTQSLSPHHVWLLGRPPAKSLGYSVSSRGGEVRLTNICCPLEYSCPLLSLPSFFLPLLHCMRLQPPDGNEQEGLAFSLEQRQNAKAMV